MKYGLTYPTEGPRTELALSALAELAAALHDLILFPFTRKSRINHIADIYMTERYLRRASKW